ncbi:hypothetical protein CCH79_00014319 [Gambusia affinis]|uniref:FGFR1 oncogene partner 2 homolog n=1 Tax=Gambusia affinis TaxID=33528 RepID=A0A315USI7_GAMAF|nr:hypothetical protein CCH79_00014319 [Gambusia affinis]
MSGCVNPFGHTDTRARPNEQHANSCLRRYCERTLLTCRAAVDSSLGRESIRTSTSLAVLAIRAANRNRVRSREGVSSNSRGSGRRCFGRVRFAVAESGFLARRRTDSRANVLADAKSLVERLRNHDNAAEMLIEQTTSLNKRVEAMKQYQEEIDSLNQVARHRPRSSLVLGIQQENRQIRELQQENKGKTLLDPRSFSPTAGILLTHSIRDRTKLVSSPPAELRTSLEEHQSALELIMTKYREQVFRLLMASKREDPTIVTQLKEQHTTAMQAHIDKINEMASVMRKAIEVDEGRVCEDEERIKQLELENSGLRELLGISREAFLVLKREEASDNTSLSPLLTSADVSLRKS